MKTRCERPYQNMIATAGAVRRLGEDAPARHVCRLATELAHAVFDLDARMRAGLTPPRAWAHAPTSDVHEVPEPKESADARLQDDQ